MLRRALLIVLLLNIPAWAESGVEVSRFSGTPMEPFVQAASRIHLMEGGRVTAVFWDLVSATESDFQALGEAGFNEVIVDGNSFEEEAAPVERMAQQVLAASRAGITSFKFVRGNPDWAGSYRASARQKIADLADRILELRETLRRSGETSASGILKGIVVNVEPYVQRGWHYDLSGYVQLHEELQTTVHSRGLTYETFDAFWIGQPVHESGNPLTGYRLAPKRTSYVMSYRHDGYEAFQVAEFFATQVPHVAGFDLVSGDYVGFRDRPQDLPQAVADYVDLTLSVPGRPGFRGIFVNASRVSDIRSLIHKLSTTALARS